MNRILRARESHVLAFLSTIAAVLCLMTAFGIWGVVVVTNPPTHWITQRRTVDVPRYVIRYRWLTEKTFLQQMVATGMNRCDLKTVDISGTDDNSTDAPAYATCVEAVTKALHTG